MMRRPLGRPAGLMWRVVLAWGLAGVAGAAAPSGVTPGNSGPAQGASFEYRQSADHVVMRYQETLSALADSDSGRSVVIYGDGRVVVHYPALMTRAGDYSLRLSPAELRALLGRVVERGFVDLDVAEARRRPQATREGGAAGRPEPPPEMFAVFDEATSTIELNLESYRPRGSQSAARKGVKTSVRFYALRAYARRYPKNAALQNLAAVQTELMALLERQDLERLP